MKRIKIKVINTIKRIFMIMSRIVIIVLKNNQNISFHLEKTRRKLRKNSKTMIKITQPNFLGRFEDV